MSARASITIPPGAPMRLESWAGGQNIILTHGDSEVLLGGTDDQLIAFAADVVRTVKEGKQRRLEDTAGIMRGTVVRERGKRKEWIVRAYLVTGDGIAAYLDAVTTGHVACRSVDLLEVIPDGGAG